MGHSLARRRVTITLMTVLFVFVVPLALALFLFGMEKMEAVVFRPRLAATPDADTNKIDDTDGAAPATDSGSSPADENDD